MKRYILITGIICMFCTLIVVAQTNDWQLKDTDGTVLMHVGDNGNVGIGTQDPQTTLEVNGSFSGYVQRIDKGQGGHSLSPDVSSTLTLEISAVGTSLENFSWVALTNLLNGSPGQILYIVARPGAYGIFTIQHRAGGTGKIHCTGNSDMEFGGYGLVVAYRSIDEDLWIVSSK